MTLILSVFGERKKGELHILKNVGVRAFKEILKNMYFIALSCFLTWFDFVWQGTQTLRYTVIAQHAYKVTCDVGDSVI